MAFLNKHGRLSIDPCILNSARDIVKYAKQVAQRTDHVASDLLITAVWCCMNCSCNQSSKTEGTAAVLTDSCCGAEKAHTNNDTQHNHGVSKGSSGVNSTSGLSSKMDSKENKNKKIEEGQVQHDNSKEPVSSEGKHEGHSEVTATSVSDQTTNNDITDNRGTGNGDGTKNSEVPDRKSNEDNAQKTESTKSGQDEGDAHVKPTKEERDEVILLEDNDHTGEDIDGTPNVSKLSEKISAVSETGAIPKTEEVKQDPVGEDPDYFDMDCEEIEDDQMFNTESSDISKMDANNDESLAEDEITIISDDESDDNSGGICKNTERDEKKKSAVNNQPDKKEIKTENTRGKTVKAECKTGKGIKTVSKQKDDQEVEIINLDSDSETEEQNYSCKKPCSQSIESSAAIKNEQGTGVEQVSAFSCSVIDVLDDMCVKKKDSAAMKPEPAKVSNIGSIKESVGSDELELKIISDSVTSCAEANASVHDVNKSEIKPAVQQSGSPTPGSSDFVPSVIGLVPNKNNKNLATSSAVPTSGMTATTITFYSAGPSWGSVTQEHPMPYTIETSQSDSRNSSESPPSKKRLLDFDKKWHMAPKLDRHHDKYLALPGGIEGNGVDSYDDRQRKLAARGRAASDWTSAGKYSPNPRVIMENVGEGYLNRKREPDPDTDDSEKEAGDSSDDRLKKATKKKVTNQRGRLKSGLKSSRGRGKSTTTSRGASKESGEDSPAPMGKSKGVRGRRSRGRSSVSSRGRGRGVGSPSSSQGSPTKGTAGSSPSWKRIGFYSVRRGTGRIGRPRGGRARGQGRGQSGSPGSWKVVLTDPAGVKKRGGRGAKRRGRKE